MEFLLYTLVVSTPRRILNPYSPLPRSPLHNSLWQISRGSLSVQLEMRTFYNVMP
jgi:hypothetical protein